MIEQLPSLIPDPARAQRVSKRCHERLTQHRRRIEAAAKPLNPRILIMERALVAGLCALYLSSAARDIARLLDH